MTLVDPALERLFVHTVNIERRAVHDDGAGGQIVKWFVVGRTRCRVSNPATSTPTEIRVALSGEIAAPYYVYIPPGTDVIRGDRLDDGDRTHFVHAVTRFSVNLYWRCECNEYQEEVPHRAPTPEEM